MRLKINLIPLENFSFNEINNYTLQGFVYSLIRNTVYTKLHESTGFKFFNFSNFFPISDFEKNSEKTIFISSPDKNLIKTMEETLKNSDIIRIGTHSFELKNFKKFDLKLKHKWLTATPIILYKNNSTNEYFSFRRNQDTSFFLKRLKENALKKYNKFYNEKFDFNGPLFDKMKFRKEAVTKLRKNKQEFILIGSQWKLLEKAKYHQNEKKFYKFLFDTGLGEKNSFGFGFINPV